MEITIKMEPEELIELARTFTGNHPIIETVTAQRDSVTATRQQQASNAEIRAWAKENKLPVSEKGVIPKDVKALFYLHQRKEIG